MKTNGGRREYHTQILSGCNWVITPDKMGSVDRVNIFLTSP